MWKVGTFSKINKLGTGGQSFGTHELLLDLKNGFKILAVFQRNVDKRL